MDVSGSLGILGWVDTERTSGVAVIRPVGPRGPQQLYNLSMLVDYALGDRSSSRPGLGCLL
jgi:hypothetical protein